MKKFCIYIFDFGLIKRDFIGIDIYKILFVNNLFVYVIRYLGCVFFFN